MATKTEEAKLSASEDSSKWQAYWDDNYKRYYWSDGNESVTTIYFFTYIFKLVFLGMGNTRRLY